MAKKTKLVRIDPELDQLFQDMAKENDLSSRQVSKKVAQILKKIKADKRKLINEIKF